MQDTGLSLASTIIVIISGGVTILGGVISIYKIIKRVESLIGVDSKGRTISDRLDRVEHQLWENGGSSLADRVNKIDAISHDTSLEVKIIKELIVSNNNDSQENTINPPKRVRKTN